MAKLKMIKASTLMETIVAMVIIVTVSGITFAILANISGEHNPSLKSAAYSEALNMISEIQACGEIKEIYEEESAPGFYITKSIQKYGDSERLYIVDITVKGVSGYELARLKKILSYEEKITGIYSY